MQFLQYIYIYIYLHSLKFEFWASSGDTNIGKPNNKNFSYNFSFLQNKKNNWKRKKEHEMIFRILFEYYYCFYYNNKCCQEQMYKRLKTFSITSVAKPFDNGTRPWQWSIVYEKSCFLQLCTFIYINLNTQR